MKRMLAALCAIALVVFVGACSAGDPLDTMYTQDVLPGATGNFSVGSPATPYAAGYFDNVTADNATFQDTTSASLHADNMTVDVLLVSGNVTLFAHLPTSDPGVSGELWSDNGTLKISEGP